MVITVNINTHALEDSSDIHGCVRAVSSLCPLQVELHVHLDGAIKPETILYFGR